MITMIIILITTLSAILMILMISLIRGQSSWWRSNIARTIVQHWPHGLPTSDQVRNSLSSLENIFHLFFSVGQQLAI